MTNDLLDPKDVHIRVIDQRIGAGIGGMNHWDRDIALQMIETALTHPKCEDFTHDQ